MIPKTSQDTPQAVFGTFNNLAAAATGVVAGNGVIRSDWVDLSGCSGLSIDVSWSGGAGGPAGTVGVEVSNLDWINLPNSTTACNSLSLSPTPAVITGNSGFTGVDASTNFRFARLTVTTTAGTYNVTALVFAKRIGGT